MATHTASVEVLTASVRVLMVGSRQVTLSVFRQLDIVARTGMTHVFGRVNEPAPDAVPRSFERMLADSLVDTSDARLIWLGANQQRPFKSAWCVGRSLDGNLVRSFDFWYVPGSHVEAICFTEPAKDGWPNGRSRKWRYTSCASLSQFLGEPVDDLILETQEDPRNYPLIVLAGLK